MTVKTFDLKNCRIARENPRTSRSDADVAKMKASLLGIGLLHSLVGYQVDGIAHITGGGTRIEALRQAVADGSIKAGNALCNAIPVTLRPKEQAVDAALSSNLVVSTMTAADQFAAYSALHDGGEGVSIEEIAERYYTDTAQVRRILKLAALAKPIFEAFAGNMISLDAAKVYAGCDDHDRQLRAFKQAKGNARFAKQVLRESTYLATDAKAALVGLDAYTEAGGRVEHDLFDDKTVLLDGQIVDDLLQEAIAAKSQSYADDGWTDVRFTEDHWTTVDKLGGTMTPKFDPTKAEKARYDAARKKRDALRREHGWYYKDAPKKVKKTAEAQERIIARIEEKRTAFTPKQKKDGILVWSFNGDTIRESVNAKPKAVKAAPRELDASGKPKPKTGYSKSFKERVRRTSGHALMTHMTQNPSRLSRVIAVMALSGDLPGADYRGSPMGSMTYGHDLPALGELGSGYIPCRYDNGKSRDPKGDIAHLLSLDDAALDAEIAKAIGARFDYVMGHDDVKATYETLAVESGFQLEHCWMFDKEELEALSKAQLLVVFGETGGDPETVAKSKKADLVRLVAERVAGTDWTPDFVRTRDLAAPTPATAKTPKEPKAKDREAGNADAVVAEAVVEDPNAAQDVTPDAATGTDD